MTNPDPHAALREHLAELRLDQIAELYPEVMNEAARKNCSPLDVLVTLVAAEVTARRERALQRRIAAARLPHRHPRRQLSPERQTTRISSGPSCSAHKNTGRTSRPDSTSDRAVAPLSCAESVAGDWAAVAGPSLASCCPVSNLW